jgi:PAS domain-containing protein
MPQNYQMNYPQQGGTAMQMSYGQAAAYNPTVFPVQPGAFAGPAGVTAPAPVYDQSFSEKIDSFMEEKVMPAIYRLSVVFSFKQVLQTFVLIFIFSVTLLAIFPLANIIKETNLKEAEKRAKSVARALAKYNEAALLSGQLANLSVTEALKEEGIKDAFIVQQSDGQIVAPPEKAGRDESSSLVLNARKESRSQYELIDSSTIGATFPISFYDPASGEASARFHAVVKYDISSLNFDEGRIVSLFMQTLIIACVLGMILYQLFARLIEYPLRTLNQQIDKAMLEKSDRTEVPFDYPAFQKLVSNVNTILNRAWSGEGALASTKPQQNKDLEFSNLIDMISHAALVVDNLDRVVAVNSGFEQLTQVSRDSVLNQSYKNLTDIALVQNVESLVARSRQTPFEKHTDKIPFSQFECEIHCQVFLDSNSEPQYFVLTLIQFG